MKFLSFLIILSVSSVIFYSAINSLNSIITKPVPSVVAAQKIDNSKLVVSSAGPFSRFAAFTDNSSASN